MELRNSGHFHFIQAIKGGLVTRVPNVSHGLPKLKFKNLADIEDGYLCDNDNVKAERSCNGVMEVEVKTEPDVFDCDDRSDGDDQRIYNLDDDGFDNFTLKQIKERCRTRKRKCSQGLDSSTAKTKSDDSSSLKDDKVKQQMEVDDTDLMETLSSWRTKLSKNMKSKKQKCVKDPISCQEIVLVVESEEFHNSQEFPLSDGDSAAPVEVKREVLENVCFDVPNDCSVIEGEEEAEFTHGWNLKSKLNYKWNDYFDLIPLQMVRSSSMDIVVINSELSSDQSTNFPAIEFEEHNSNIPDNQLDDDDDDTPVSPPNVATHTSLECTSVELRDDNDLLGDCSKDGLTAGSVVQAKPCSNFEPGVGPDGYLVCRSDVSPEYEGKQSFASVCGDDDDDDDDDDTPVSPPNVATHTSLECTNVELRDDNDLLGDCSKDELIAGSEVQAKPCSNFEPGVSPDGYLVCRSDVSPEYEGKQSFASVCDDEKMHVASEELSSCDKFNGSSKLHGPERLLSTRKAISPSSQEKICKAMASVDLGDKNNLKCSGQLHFTEQTDKDGDVEGLNDIMRTGLTNNRDKISANPKVSKRGPSSKGISKIPNSSRSATRLGCSTLQSCSKSAIAFSKQQLYDVECIATKLTKELKAMKEIVDDMLRSEFCLNTSLRYKVNEARMAVKKATKAEEGAKRCLSFMARDCNRFCKIMQLADDSCPPPPQDVVRKEKRIAFADEAGGSLCQVRVYEDDAVHLSESN